MLSPALLQDVNGRQSRFRELLESERCHMGHLREIMVDGCESGYGGRIGLVLKNGIPGGYDGRITSNELAMCIITKNPGNYRGGQLENCCLGTS